MLIALLFGGLATFAQLYSVQAVLPGIARDFQVSAADAALSVSAATIGLALAVIPWSAIADRAGRKRTMTWAISAAVVLGLLLPLAPTFPSMLALRFLEGAALGGIPAVALVYLNEEVQRLHAAVAAGTYVAGTTIGGLAGRLVAGPVAEFTEWRAGVLAVSMLSGVAAVLFVRLAPAPRGFRPVVRGQGPKLAERILINLRSPRLLALYTQGFLLMGGFVAVYNYLGFRLEAPPFNLPTSLASLLFLAYLAGTVSSRLAGGLTVRFGRLRVLLASIPVIIAGLAITLADSLPVILVGLVVFTAGFFGAHSVASGWTPRLATVGQSQASGLYNLFYYAGSSLLGWAGGLFFVQFGWSGVAIFAAVLALLAGTTAVLALRGYEAK
ncbi:MFS transporter [Arthrobacter crystallopoietes]|uniref:MFS transporter n=1 Tax=Crystallibacter crystallopoietes TaxID=37928 RepID=UPI001ABE1893|nr:MFS transporter [Arthrobacter crystallopoietes]QTG82909.1 MFS transporter [Arthrobacter crystallopoietes]